MNWKQEAINDLFKLQRQRQALVNIPEQIALLREDIQSIKTGRTDKISVQGSCNSCEDQLLNNIVKRGKLKENYHTTRRIVDCMDRALQSLSDKQRRVLELFYVERQRGHVEQLCTEMGYEQARVYQLKDNALYDFTIALYGAGEL